MLSLPQVLPSTLLSLMILATGAGTLAAQVQVEAIPGRPFGVARITVPLTDADADVAAVGGFRISDRESRVFYPAFGQGIMQGLLNDLLGDNRVRPARELTVHFLFRGDAPLDVTVRTASPVAVRVIPRPPRRRLAELRLWRGWWRAYYEAAQRQTDAGDYPPLIETYLTAMLGRRLGLEPPLLRRQDLPETSEFRQTLQLLFGTESYRLAIMRDTVLGESDFGEPLVAELPPEPRWTPRIYPELADPPTIESIAKHVPEECFYIRFGTWDNQLWLTQLLEQYGGDLSRMINLRGQDNHATQKMMEQLLLEQSAISELLGGQLISDVAVIGRDTFVTEGSATGVILEGRNALLGTALAQQRRATARQLAEQGATFETITIDDRDVTLISTPDNRIRSFYAQDGNYHLTTNCRALVERFFAAGEGYRSLAASDEFAHARSLMPVEREDTIFVYFSTAFLQGLVSPHYQIELARRTKSLTDLELVRLARLAAAREGLVNATLDELIEAGFLPPGFGRRPDGSGPIIAGPLSLDSKRGARGYFLPIPDVELTSITASERDTYLRRADYYETQWQQFDPLMVGLQRVAIDDRRERVTIDAQVAPFGEEKYGWLFSILGDPLPFRMATTPDDIMYAEASVRGGLLLPSVPPHTLFAAVQDDRAPQTDLQPTGFFQILQILRTTPGYLGAWPKPGFLDLLPIGLGAEPDAAGFTRSLLGVWRWQNVEYSLLSFDRERLAAAAAHIGQVDATVPAQIRLYVGDLSRSALRHWANVLTYTRARQTSLGNSRMLHALTQQFGLPPEQARDTAEQLLGVDLVCALGGEYELRETGPLAGYWLSDAIDTPTSTALPADFRSPLLAWFRGCDASLNKSESRMKVHLVLDMERRADGAAEDE